MKSQILDAGPTRTCSKIRAAASSEWAPVIAALGPKGAPVDYKTGYTTLTWSLGEFVTGGLKINVFH